MIPRFYLTCIFLCATCSTRAQNTWLESADSLFRAQAYGDAAVAYERVLFQSPDNAVYASAVLGKIACYKRLGDFQAESNFIQHSLATLVSDSLYYQLGYERTLCEYLQNQYETALSLAEQLQFRFPGRREPVSLTLVRILSLNRLQRWKEAGALYHRLMDSLGGRYVDLYRHKPRLKKLSTEHWLSMATIGGGLFYAGRPLEGMVSIVLQVGFLAYGVYCWEGGYYISAWLVGGGLAGAFHQGSDRRAEFLVNRWNAKAMEKLDREVKSQVTAACTSDAPRKKAGDAAAPPAKVVSVTAN